MLLKHPEAWAPLQTQWNLCLQQWGFGLWIFTISQMTDQSLFEPWCWIYFPRLQESFQGVVWEEAPPWVCHVDWTSAWRYSCTEACLSSLFPLRVSYCRQSKYVTLQKYFYLLFDCPESKLWHVESSSPTRDWTQVPCMGRSILNLWTPREVPWFMLKGSFDELKIGRTVFSRLSSTQRNLMTSISFILLLQRQKIWRFYSEPM